MDDPSKSSFDHIRCIFDYINGDFVVCSMENFRQLNVWIDSSLSILSALVCVDAAQKDS